MLVSCIMLTHNRRHLILVALQSYLAQDWRERELVVIDDGADGVADLFESVPNVTYVRFPEKMAVGLKVNVACEHAQGELIATWDDDDWSAPDRLSDQVALLERSGKAFTGYSTVLFYNGRQAWRYLGEKHYAVGTTQTYLKSFWEQHGCAAKDVGYDNDLWAQAHREGQVITTEGRGMMVARIHDRNVSGERRNLGGAMWPEVSLSEIPKTFLETLR